MNKTINRQIKRGDILQIKNDVNNSHNFFPNLLPPGTVCTAASNEQNGVFDILIGRFALSEEGKIVCQKNKDKDIISNAYDSLFDLVMTIEDQQKYFPYYIDFDLDGVFVNKIGYDAVHLAYCPFDFTDEETHGKTSTTAYNIAIEMVTDYCNKLNDLHYKHNK